ncbi:hypothetical protein ACFYT4_29425 [Streptomyces sp. NPDC004609]|uniref:hypothetical protein n=1 Tax=Streptomyces sp. NPDC004609 TaxID=3364704 RepID=UPI0036908A66
MPPQASTDDTPAPPPTHRTTTTEQGSFAVAVCGCGWRGPARRSRERARTDAAEHASAPLARAGCA